MTLSVEQLLMIGAAAVSVITTMAGVVYRELKAQIADRDKRIATYELAAAEALRAKDAEIAEWKRLLTQSHGREAPR